MKACTRTKNEAECGDEGALTKLENAPWVSGHKHPLADVNLFF